MNVKEEVDTSSPEPSYLFRADDDYKMGNPVGFELDSQDAALFRYSKSSGACS